MPKKKVIISLLSAIGLSLLGWFIYVHLNYVSTDNATVQAHSLMLSPKVSGVVTKVLVDENQTVKKGDILAEIDERDFLIASSQAQAELESARARALDAELTYKRFSKLIKESAVSRQQFDDAEIKARELNHKVQAGQAQLDQAKLNLEYTKVKAPSDGSIAKKSVEVGSLVSAGQPLFGFVSSEERWVTANFKETELADIHIGQRVKISVDAIPNRSFNGEVESISSSTGSTFSLLPPDNSTGNFTKVVQRIPVKIKLQNLSGDEIKLLQAGLSADVSVSIR